MAWIYLVIAGLFEIAWAVGLKYTEGFTRLWPSAWTVTAMIVSFLFLAESLKSIPVGTGYAVWTGIGAAGTALMGILLFEESRDLFRVMCILTIVAAIAGLKLSSPA
ncbi:MAG: quaternary ammonium compound efflux SMR transporter SugE [Nitrospiraceae bacterium]